MYIISVTLLGTLALSNVSHTPVFPYIWVPLYIFIHRSNCSACMGNLSLPSQEKAIKKRLSSSERVLAIHSLL